MSTTLNSNVGCHNFQACVSETSNREIIERETTRRRTNFCGQHDVIKSSKVPISLCALHELRVYKEVLTTMILLLGPQNAWDSTASGGNWRHE